MTEKKRRRVPLTRKVRRGLRRIADTPEYSDIFSEVMPEHFSAKERSDAKAAFNWIEDATLGY